MWPSVANYGPDVHGGPSLNMDFETTSKIFSETSSGLRSALNFGEPRFRRCRHLILRRQECRKTIFFEKLWAAVYPPGMAPFGLRIWENAFQVILDICLIFRRWKRKWLFGRDRQRRLEKRTPQFWFSALYDFSQRGKRCGLYFSPRHSAKKDFRKKEKQKYEITKWWHSVCSVLARRHMRPD